MQRLPVIPVTLGGCLVVAVVGLAAATTETSTVGVLLAVAVAVGVLSAVVADRRAWLAVTVSGALTFLVAVDDGENGWPYLVFLVLAAVLGRGQRWMRPHSKPLPIIDRHVRGSSRPMP
ncbi:hypothetical protein [Asanoa siamensis]|nr:hypothetical protein [Asanoa siamensis]